MDSGSEEAGFPATPGGFLSQTMRSTDPLPKRRLHIGPRNQARLEQVKRRSLEISRRLAGSFPQAQVPLNHRNPYELLIATILSAQCTDEQVNRITPPLFRRFPDPASLARASLPEIEGIIHPLGLFRSKARALKETARKIWKEYGGRVPADMASLTRLPGVGRKTANVLLGHAFGIPGIAVDTHVKRVARRLGLTKNNDPGKIERDLMELLPPREWSSFSLHLILHGRKTCWAKQPQCGRCFLLDLCPSSQI